MQRFYFNETYPATSIPFDKLLFQGVTYVGDDYVSLLFNDVNWGPAHPYSALDGVTIDRSTGEVVDVDRFIDDSGEEIEENIRAALGKEVVYDRETWDYYITEKEVVLFYHDPRFWEAVATKR